MPEVLFECLGRIARAEHTRCAKYGFRYPQNRKRIFVVSIYGENDFDFEVLILFS